MDSLEAKVQDLDARPDMDVDKTLSGGIDRFAAKVSASSKSNGNIK